MTFFQATDIGNAPRGLPSSSVDDQTLCSTLTGGGESDVLLEPVSAGSASAGAAVPARLPAAAAAAPRRRHALQERELSLQEAPEPSRVESGVLNQQQQPATTKPCTEPAAAACNNRAVC